MVFVLAWLAALNLSAGERPKYAEGIAPLHIDHAYLKNNPAPDFWLINSHYTGQFNDYSCSAASVAILVNALLSANNKDSAESFQNINQQTLVSKVKTLPWKDLVSDRGYDGKHGLNISGLQSVTQEALGLSGLNNYYATVRQFEKNDLNALKAILQENEKSADDMVLIHFLQDLLTGAKGGPFPHISIIGAYDKEKARALIMDVDRAWYVPYWTPVEKLLTAINTPSASFGKGGVVVVRKKKRSP